jgi:hypothetical protein
VHQESFKKYVGTILTRKNTRTDIYYRDDPSIFGWEIANEPSNPGDDSGDVVQVRHKGCGARTILAALHSCRMRCTANPNVSRMVLAYTARAL